MSPNTLRCSILFSGLIAASSAFGGSDIVKCVDQSGHVTLTDEPCGPGVQTVELAAASDQPPGVPAASDEPADAPAAAAVQHGRAIEHVALARTPMGHDNWVKKPGATHMLSRDVATLKMARFNMQVMDHASASMRQQRLAGLN
jgi:hypothetical protein